MNRDVKHSTFGDELMLLYGRARLSQREFAHLVGVSSVALRKWESGESCPKAESLKRVIEILLRQGVFSLGEERPEAMHLWELANRRGLKVPFDEVWFSTVAVVSRTDPVPGTTGQPTDQGEEENLIVPPTSSDVSDTHRTVPDMPYRHQSEAVRIVPDTDTGSTPYKTRGRRKGLLALLIALVILTIIGGSAGALFFYVRGHATDPAYPGYLSGHGTLLFFDPLSQERGSEWSSYSINGTGGACQFIGGAYHASQQQTKYLQWCPTRRTFDNFAFEVQLTITRGNCGGVIFRIENLEHYYYFGVCQNGRSGLRKYVSLSDSDSQLLYITNNPAIHAGLGHQNTIAVIASGSTMTFYVNEQEIAHVWDSSYTVGQVALVAGPYQGGFGDDVTDVAYRNARLWTL